MAESLQDSCLFNNITTGIMCATNSNIKNHDETFAINVTSSSVVSNVNHPAGASYQNNYVKPWPFLKHSMPMIIVLSIAYILVFLLGVINNCLVVCVIYRNKQLRTVTNYFIANLAVADVLVCIFVLPITLLSNIYWEWWYGPLVCKAAPYLQGVAVGASVNTLAAVAIERTKVKTNNPKVLVGDCLALLGETVTKLIGFTHKRGLLAIGAAIGSYFGGVHKFVILIYLAIFYPHTRRLTPQNACVMIGVIWVIPMCIFIPWIVVYVQKIYRIQGFNYIICTAQWSQLEKRKMFTLFTTVTCYLLPLISIATFYFLIGLRVWNRKVRGLHGRAERNINRSKVRIVRMLVVVFVMFVFSWLPLYSIELRLLFGPAPDGEEKTILKNYILPFAQWLGASNSCVNIFIYVYFSKNFRKSIMTVVCNKSWCGKINTRNLF